MHKSLLIPLLILAVLPACSKKTSPSAPAPSPSPFPAPILLSGSLGSFDPSLAADPSASRVWMSYSAVDPSAAWPSQNPQVVSTRLAFSDDAGATFSDAGEVNPFLDVDLSPLPAPLNAGTWQNEVSTLVFDPQAPAARRWKLVWHHYLVVNNLRLLAEHAWIGLKMASDPALLASAPEIKLFTSAGYSTDNDTAGGNTKSPLGGGPVLALDAAFPALTGGIFSEPGLLAYDSNLYLALLCVQPGVDHRIVLLRCCSTCDPASAGSWEYLGSPLGEAEALPYGYDQGFSAPALFASTSGLHLIVTPVSSVPFDGFYNGSWVYRFSDIGTAALSGRVGVVNGVAGTFNGAAAFLPAASQPGLVYSQYVEGGTKPFQLMKSGVLF